MERKWLITGGAGFFGINLVRYLLQRGQSVRSLDVADFTFRDVKDRIEVIKGDIRDVPTVVAAVKGIDVVVHAAAALPLYSDVDIFSTEVDGTRNVLDASLANGVGRVVHISSTAVYGVPDHHPLRETDALSGVGSYGKAKILAEEACQQYRAKGLCVSVLRPKTFIGPERLGVFALLYQWAREGRNFPILGNGRNRYQLLDVEDLCQAVHLAATRDEAVVNDVFNIGAKQFATMAEDFQAVLDRAGHGRRIRCLPAWPAKTALKVLELLRLSPLYGWVYETAAKDSFVSIEKAEQVLGYAPRYSNQDALLRNFQWYIDNEHRFVAASGISHTVPWKAGMLNVAKLFF